MVAFARRGSHSLSSGSMLDLNILELHLGVDWRRQSRLQRHQTALDVRDEAETAVWVGMTSTLVLRQLRDATEEVRHVGVHDRWINGSDENAIGIDCWRHGGNSTHANDFELCHRAMRSLDRG